MEKDTINLIQFDTETAFQSFSNFELKKKAFFLQMMGIPWLSNALQRFTLWAIEVKLPITIFIKHSIFSMFCGGVALSDISRILKVLKDQKVGVLLNFGMELKQTEKAFDFCLNEILSAINYASTNPSIKGICVKVTSLGDAEILEKRQALELLNENEEKSYERLLYRLIQISEAIVKNKVTLLFDAEESWIQEEIDRLVETLMEKYNSSNALIFNTFQLYRKGRLTYLHQQIGIAKQNNYVLGAKIVRGAYMEKERARAFEYSYQSPIHDSKPPVDAEFEEGISLCLENISNVNFVLASQNQSNHTFLVNEMNRLQIHPNHPNISVSQLYGMGDIITFTMANTGYNATKYLPYGPVKDVIPYLIRRMAENSSVSGHMGRELELVISELKRRKVKIREYIF